MYFNKGTKIGKLTNENCTIKGFINNEWDIHDLNFEYYPFIILITCIRHIVRIINCIPFRVIYNNIIISRS